MTIIRVPIDWFECTDTQKCSSKKQTKKLLHRFVQTMICSGINLKMTGLWFSSSGLRPTVVLLNSSEKLNFCVNQIRSLVSSRTQLIFSEEKNQQKKLQYVQNHALAAAFLKV